MEKGFIFETKQQVSNFLKQFIYVTGEDVDQTWQDLCDGKVSDREVTLMRLSTAIQGSPLYGELLKVNNERGGR